MPYGIFIFLQFLEYALMANLRISVVVKKLAVESNTWPLFPFFEHFDQNIIDAFMEIVQLYEKFEHLSKRW